jgi:hypothetical protein
MDTSDGTTDTLLTDITGYLSSTNYLNPLLVNISGIDYLFGTSLLSTHLRAFKINIDTETLGWETTIDASLGDGSSNRYIAYSPVYDKAYVGWTSDATPTSARITSIYNSSGTVDDIINFHNDGNNAKVIQTWYDTVNKRIVFTIVNALNLTDGIHAFLTETPPMDDSDYIGTSWQCEDDFFFRDNCYIASYLPSGATPRVFSFYYVDKYQID